MEFTLGDIAISEVSETQMPRRTRQGTQSRFTK